MFVTKFVFFRPYVIHLLPNMRAKFKSHCGFHNISISHDDQSPNVSFTQIKQVLNRNGCNFEDGYTCIKIPCLNCTTEANGTLYINKITGFFMCMECQHCGSWDNLVAEIKKKDKKSTVLQKAVLEKKLKLKDTNVAQLGYNKWVEIIESCKPLFKLSKEEQQNVCASFNLNIISEHIIKELQVYFDNENLYFPLKNNDKQIVGYKQISKLFEEISVPVNQCPGILRYIPNRVKKKLESAIIVHTVKDLIALSLYKLQFHIICLPHGVMTLPQEVLPSLEQYKKIVLWFGNEVVCLDPIRTFSRKLSERRCSFVRATEDYSTAYIAHSKCQDVKTIIDSAYPVSHSSIITFSSLRQDVLSDILNKDKIQGTKWKRFTKLNEILHGHRRGELTILTGPTGCGKTTFISEYSLDLSQQGVSTLWGSFEIRNQRLARTMMQQMVMVPLDKHLDKFEMWADQFELLPIYFMTFHGPQQVKVVLEAVIHATYIHDIAHVIIDNLQFMMGTSSSDKYMDRFYKQDTIIGEFRSFATKYNCHVTLIIHPRKEREAEELTISSIFGGAKATQEADNVLIIQRKILQSLSIKKYLQVAKNRYSGDLGIVPLVFNKAALSFGEKKDKSSDDTV